jgi:hypothetical protein
VSGFTVVKDLMRDEGPLALFKGLTPKVRTSEQRAIQKKKTKDYN